MTFLERYSQETTWHGKALIMELYHLAMTHRFSQWTISKTAEHFQVSVGLVSENLKLASLIHVDPSLSEIRSRQDALNRARRMR